MKHMFDFLESQILSKSISEQKIILSNLIATYCENVAISPVLWDSFKKEEQDNYIKMFGDTIYEKGSLHDNKNFNLFE